MRPIYKNQAGIAAQHARQLEGHKVEEFSDRGGWKHRDAYTQLEVVTYYGSPNSRRKPRDITVDIQRHLSKSLLIYRS